VTGRPPSYSNVSVMSSPVENDIGVAPLPARARLLVHGTRHTRHTLPGSRARRNHVHVLHRDPLGSLPLVISVLGRSVLVVGCRGD
jgi:hypothetical protein